MTFIINTSKYKFTLYFHNKYETQYAVIDNSARHSYSWGRSPYVRYDCDPKNADNRARVVILDYPICLVLRTD